MRRPIRPRVVMPRLRRSERVAQGRESMAQAQISATPLNPPQATSLNLLSPSNPPPPSFKPFPRLPLEIRQMIWELTLEARVVELQLSDESGFYSTCSLPVALQISVESRATVERLYGTRFSSPQNPRGIPFNYAIDTLYLSQPLFEHADKILSSLKEISGVRFLAIDFDDFDRPCKCGTCSHTLTSVANCELFCSALKGLNLKEIKTVYDLGFSLSDDLEEFERFMQVDKTVKSKAMRFFDDVPPEFRRIGLELEHKGWCEAFHSLKDCKYSSVFGLRENVFLDI